MNTVGEPYSGKPNVRIDEGRPGEAVPNRAAYSTAEALGAPVRILTRHGGDQRPDLGLQARPCRRGPSTPAPEEAAALAMPAQHGLGLDQEEVASPLPVEAVDEKPEELVWGSEARRRWLRRATWSCWRRSRFSGRRRSRLRKALMRAARRSRRRIIGGRIADSHHVAGAGRRLLPPYSSCRHPPRPAHPRPSAPRWCLRRLGSADCHPFPHPAHGPR
jgi:hypothetical protein